MEPGPEPSYIRICGNVGRGRVLSGEPGDQFWGVVLLLPACAGTSLAPYGPQSPHQEKRALDQMLSGVSADSKTYIFCEPQRAGAPQGKSATDLAKAAEICPAGHRVPLITTCREAACWLVTRLSLLPPHPPMPRHLPDCTQGIRGHGGCYLVQNAGPSFRGMSQVRLQVTQIATLCEVPMRTAVPRGQRAVAVASAGH